ncbi:tetratricopeptide repeat protein [Geobacter luticola]|uniref:Tetratricopeptide repeat protein n=2 Tax=Geomobilimonas luticola TaxID=1114878 RepID=A0ABS5SG21_9BACT|nr:tetratricopeptide repeat protein [Geomobilimonas luticola]MBT0653612.1 tetratricopeptide repeat protein [Geomobilimonas luticola]
MGLSNFTEGNYTSALVEFTEAEKLTPDDPELLYYLGRTYFEKKKYDLAEQRYLKSLALKPNNSSARNDLGVDYLEMKRWDDAIIQFKIVSEDIFFQNQEAASVNLGIAYFNKGDYPRALSVLRSVVGNNPREPRARLNLGKVYFAMDKIDLAIGEYNRAIELNSNYANAHYNLGLAYLKQKENRAAATAFREVLRIAPESELGQLAREYLDVLK